MVSPKIHIFLLLKNSFYLFCLLKPQLLRIKRFVLANLPDFFRIILQTASFVKIPRLSACFSQENVGQVLICYFYLPDSMKIQSGRFHYLLQAYLYFTELEILYIVLAEKLLLKVEDLVILETCKLRLILFAYSFHIFTQYFWSILQSVLLFFSKLCYQTDIEGWELIFIVNFSIIVVRTFDYFEIIFINGRMKLNVILQCLFWIL